MAFILLQSVFTSVIELLYKLSYSLFSLVCKALIPKRVCSSCGSSFLFSLERSLFTKKQSLSLTKQRDKLLSVGDRKRKIDTKTERKSK